MFHKPTKKYYFCNVYNPFDNNERFCVILNDITDFKNTELELVKAREKEEKAKIYLDNIIKPISNCVVVFLIVCNHDCNF
jgi:hypothetical protein